MVSLVDVLIGPQCPLLPPVVVGAIGPIGLWLDDGDRDIACREVAGKLPATIMADALSAGYVGLAATGGDPVVVTCLYDLEPDPVTGWPWPVYLGVVPVAGLTAYFESLVTVGR